jgi:enterochelin esterase-like enzyme
VRTEVVDKRLPRNLPVRVYLPACYDAQSSALFPVVFLLHGLTYTDSQWDDLGVDETMDSLLAAGRVSPALIVMPWERTGIDLEQAIPQVLIPYIDRHYRTISDRSSRAIGGISRGGGWALRIGLLHPDLFASIGLHSPAVLPPDLFRIPDWAPAIPPSEAPRIWIDMGDRDTLRFDLAKLKGVLDESGIHYQAHTYPGEHTSAYWSAHLESYLLWYGLGWQSTSTP